MYNVVELFSGIGSQAKALKNLGYNVEYDRWIRGTWFGNKQISMIKKSDVLLFYKEKSEKLSSGTIRCLHKYIHPALEMAVDDDLIRKNPSNNCTKD